MIMIIRGVKYDNAFSEFCPNPVTDMQVPYLKITDSGEETTETTPWQFITGSGNNYTLPQNKTSETLTAYIFCTDEPKVEELSFNAINVGNVTLKIYHKNGTKIVEMVNPVCTINYFIPSDLLSIIFKGVSGVFQFCMLFQ